MKKRNVVIHVLVILMLMATFATYSLAGTSESVGNYIDDTVITTKVKSLLASDDFLKSFQISVESRQGMVQLSGFVDSAKAVDKAGQIARGVEGVKSVRNDLIIK